MDRGMLRAVSAPPLPTWEDALGRSPRTALLRALVGAHCRGREREEGVGHGMAWQHRCTMRGPQLAIHLLFEGHAAWTTQQSPIIAMCKANGMCDAAQGSV